MVNEELRHELLAMRDEDLTVREELLKANSADRTSRAWKRFTSKIPSGLRN